MIYSPDKWYWIVAGDASQVWSSVVAGYVPLTDADYEAFLAAGGAPSSIASIDELKALFEEWYPGGMLATYAAAVRYAKETGGVSVNGLVYPSDRDSQAKFTAAALFAQVDGSQTFRWKLSDGTFSPLLTAAQMIAVAAAVGGFVNGCFETEATVLTGITGGSITTRAQIDTAFAG